MRDKKVGMGRNGKGGWEERDEKGGMRREG